MEWFVQICFICMTIGLICVSGALIVHIKQSKVTIRELRSEICREILTANQGSISEAEGENNEKSVPEFNEKDIEDIWRLAKYASESGRSASFTVKDLIDAKRILLDTRKYKTRQEYPCEYYAGPDGKLTRYIKV